VGWNERQREKQQRVERMQAQLQEQKRRLEEMQDSARKQGYGSSVYDP
jgi:predicted ribosome quality control (RQC) complex YloA/Tae2 family protein